MDNEKKTLTHSEIEAIFNEAKKNGSLRDSFLAHTDPSYGITDIAYLFPEFQNDSKEPHEIVKSNDYTNIVLSGVSKLPFSRVKNISADYTVDTLRAKGYVKASQKANDVLTLAKRTTEPTTVYKKTKIDRDDMIDITDMSVVAYLKKYMRAKLDEEIAKCILLGDLRASSDSYKIDETCIRPIITDDTLYTVAYQLTKAQYDDPDQVIDYVMDNRSDYKGSGSPTMFIDESFLNTLLKIKDTNGRRIYKTKEDLAPMFRVSRIVEVDEMSQVNHATKGNPLMIIVNLADYGVGATKGGEVNFFDDFDIDYNQEKYLIETRCSGALMVPKSALVFFYKAPTP